MINQILQNERPVKFRALSIATAVVASIMLSATAASAQATGDFKVTGLGYTNDVATVSGTVNRGAIQSGKNVVVEISYEYSFVAEKIETIAGQTSTVLVFVPGRCVTQGSAALADAACYYQSGAAAGQPKALNGSIWTGSYQTQTVTTEPQTITHVFSGANGMTAITEPTIEKGRLNPKGKITGYNWSSSQSIVPNASLVDPALVPEGYTVVSVAINSVSFTAFLVDANGYQIADTVMAGEFAVPQ